MGIKAFFSKPLAKLIHNQNQSWITNPVKAQETVFNQLRDGLKMTSFGNDHKAKDILNQKDFSDCIPIRDYEDLKPYINQVLEGQENVLWKGKPTYFAKTSGTTSGAKYIPITKDSMPNHINSARDALLNYVHETGNSAFFDKNLMFLSGSPTLDKKNGIYTGRLSGIVNHHIPGILKKNQKPSYETNCIEDWETKLDAIIEETINSPMSLISGIPPWVQMYFDKISERTGKKIKDVFPDFELFVYGGVNFEPYKQKMFESIGKKIASIETYPASEGFIAYQNAQDNEGMLMLLNSGIYYEFIVAEEYFQENPKRISIQDVQIGVNYAIIINSNAGLWGYSIGDTIKFVSLEPVKIIVTGRIKHFISAFGEHVIGEEIEKAMQNTRTLHPEVEIVEFTVAPSVNPEKGTSRHEWFVEFATAPNDLIRFEQDLDEALVKLNIYYKDLIGGNILQKLRVYPLAPKSFIEYMRSEGKLGGQNKVPRLSNDRKIADGLMKFVQ
jgi:GH3 auxin-responsive promoter